MSIHTDSATGRMIDTDFNEVLPKLCPYHFDFHKDIGDEDEYELDPKADGDSCEACIHNHETSCPDPDPDHKGIKS